MQNSKMTLVTAAALVFIPAIASAAPITPGNLLIYRVGDGAAALTTAAAAVFIDEYTTTGSLVQSFPLTTTGTSALSATGNSTTEGILSVSADGLDLIFTGYRKDTGGTNPSADAPATTNRVIGSLSLTGATLSTSTSLTTTTASIRSAATASVAGGTYYVGTSTQVAYLPAASTITTQIDARNSRQVQVIGSTLFASNGSTTITAKVQTYGTSPTTATAAVPVATLALGDAVNGFAFADLSPSIAGNDTLYVNSTVETLVRKFTFDGTTWNPSGSFASSAQNITLTTLPSGNVQLFLTSGAALTTFTDASGYNGTLTGASTAITTATTNTAFRGIALAAIPEPSSALLLLPAIPLLSRRRR